MSDQDESSPANQMDERTTGTRIKFVILLQLHRVAVTIGLALAIFIAFMLVVSRFETSFVQQLGSGDMIDSIFTTMISVILTGTTLVVSIGQLVLTQETGPLGDQRQRMSNAMEFREFTTELTGQPSPTDPGNFLGALVDATITRSLALRENVDTANSAALQEEIDVFVEQLLDNARAVSERLNGAEFGTFRVLSAALDFNYSWKIARIERLQNEYAEELSTADVALLEDLKTTLTMYGPAREHIKTLYFQWELINLSQMILYAAIPAVVVATLMIAVVEPSTVPGTLYGYNQITLLVGGAFVVTLLPFLLFVSYILRILTVAKHTLAIEPLVLRK